MFSILFVCSGNQHRSASAESFVRLLASDLPVEVASAGTLGIQHAPAAPEAIAFASSVGADLSKHRSRALEPEQVQRSNLICGFELIHVATAVVEGGAPQERTFTLPEVVDLLENLPRPEEADPEARARAQVVRAQALRVEQGAFAPGEEVADPIGRPRADQERTLRLIWELCEALVTGLFGEGRG